MKTLLSRLFGGSGTKEEPPAQQASRSEALAYEGLLIMSSPLREGDRWRLAGVIVKESEEGKLERTFIRADTFATREEADDFALRKGKQIINERGTRLFADGAEEGMV